MDKKDAVITFLLIGIIVSGISNIVIILNLPKFLPSEEGSTIIIGTLNGPYTLEPVDSWDSASSDVLEQVIETLFTHDLMDLNLPRINLLAESYYWKNKTCLQIKLREGIHFHDGTLFNASAAKWNLDRLLYLTNCTGNNTGEVAFTQYIWMFPDKITPIMQSISIIGNYNITITLNAPYGPLLNTLSYINAGMISPTAHKEEEKRFIDHLTGTPIGTGPFKYDYYKPEKVVILSRWEGYWRNLAHFQTLKYLIFEENLDLETAMLTHQIDYSIKVSTSSLPSYESDSSITVKRFTDDTGKPNLVYQYLGINNERYNVTWRKTFSYAINYSYIIDVLLQGNAIRANSPISPGFGGSYNESTIAPDYNITKAREIMVSMGFGNMSWTDSQWEAVAEGSTPFSNPIYYYNLGNSYRENLGGELDGWFKLIGVSVISDLFDPFNPYEELQLFAVGWYPDYLDPFNMLYPLVNPLSELNAAQINDTMLNNLMELALNTTDDAEREIIYKNIQSYMAEEGFFHAYLYHPKIYFVHSADLYGTPYNAMGKFQAYWIRRG